MLPELLCGLVPCVFALGIPGIEGQNLAASAAFQRPVGIQTVGKKVADRCQRKGPKSTLGTIQAGQVTFLNHAREELLRVLACLFGTVPALSAVACRYRTNRSNASVYES